MLRCYADFLYEFTSPQIDCPSCNTALSSYSVKELLFLWIDIACGGFLDRHSHHGGDESGEEGLGRYLEVWYYGIMV